MLYREEETQLLVSRIRVAWSCTLEDRHCAEVSQNLECTGDPALCITYPSNIKHIPLSLFRTLIQVEVTSG
jgi:hypothetical protein